LEFKGTRQLIENKHDTFIMPSGYWKQEDYVPHGTRNFPSRRNKKRDQVVFETSRPIGVRENKKCYERTQYLFEKNRIPFLEFRGTQHVIDNRIVMPFIPACF